VTPAELRAARKRLGLTQKGLARALRMGTHGWQTISKWESDNNKRGVPGPVQVAIESLLAALNETGTNDRDSDGDSDNRKEAVS
jgi:transcriptional regulator with XRE-family HTH domain